MAGRGDFHVEYDNFMELEVKNLTFDDDDEENKMQLGVLDVYYDCLKERVCSKSGKSVLQTAYG
jgi:hypothetical protein